MVYDTDYYTSRRPAYSRPTISSYTVTPYFDPIFDDSYTTTYKYYSPIRVTPSYSRVGSFISRPSFRFSYDADYPDVSYYGYKSYVPIPMTRIATLPSSVYRERLSPIRIITPSARIFQRDVASPVRIVSSPARIVNVRVRPSVLSREFDRIERKYRSSPVGVNDTEEYLNSPYAMNFSDETREIRASTRRLLKEVHEPVRRSQSLPPRYVRGSSVQPNFSRYDPQVDNEFYVSKNIIRPTRKVRDQIEILSNFKYREPPRRYTGISHLASARIVGDKPYYTRNSLMCEFELSDYGNEEIRNHINMLSFYAKNRELVAADDSVGHRAKKDKENNIENKPLVIAKPVVLNDNKIQTIMESEVESKIDSIPINGLTETPASG